MQTLILPPVPVGCANQISNHSHPQPPIPRSNLMGCAMDVRIRMERKVHDRGYINYPSCAKTSPRWLLAIAKAFVLPF